jgi:hypothetical protein
MEKMAQTSDVELVLTTSKSILVITKLRRALETDKELKKLHGHVIAHCIIVSDHINRIKAALGPNDELLTRILGLFESLITVGPANAGEEPYSKQRSLNHGWDGLQGQSLDAKLRFAERFLDIGNPAGSHRWQGFDTALDLWEGNVLSRYPEDGSQWSAEDCPQPKRRREEPSYAVWKAAQSLLGPSTPRRGVFAARPMRCRPSSFLEPIADPSPVWMMEMMLTCSSHYTNMCRRRM